MSNDTDTQADRCNRLADYLETLPESRYYHGAFVDNEASVKECGTVCCALGHAADVSKTLFRGLGIELSEDVVDGDLQIITKSKKGLGYAADAYFGKDAYNRVFSEDAYDDFNPKIGTVIRQLRKFAKVLTPSV